MKLSSKLTVLSSLLVTCLALSACQDVSSTTKTDSNQALKTDDEIIDPVDNLAIDDASISEEQQLIKTLSQYRWILFTAVDKNTQPVALLTSINEQVIFNFSQYQGQNTISYTVGCNMMNAAFELRADKLVIEDSMSTKMSCGDLNDAENQLNELMQGDSQLSMVEGVPPMLTQVTSDSVTLVWQGIMTAQAKYNSKGETIFWAVEANTKPCAENSVQRCLQIKPVTYDEQGIKIAEGEFAEFNGVIDGYEHSDMYDEVLRLQRFKTDVDTVLVDNKDSEYAYVLDMVIESSALEPK